MPSPVWSSSCVSVTASAHSAGQPAADFSWNGEPAAASSGLTAESIAIPAAEKYRSANAAASGFESEAISKNVESYTGVGGAVDLSATPATSVRTIASPPPFGASTATDTPATLCVARSASSVAVEEQGDMFGRSRSPARRVAALQSMARGAEIRDDLTRARRSSGGKQSPQRAMSRFSSRRLHDRGALAAPHRAAGDALTR